MSDNPPAEVRTIPLAIGAMTVQYEITIGDGRRISYAFPIDATVGREDLDQLLDVCGGAAERRQAIFELPLVKASVIGNKAKLRSQLKERERVRAQAEARTVLRGTERRIPKPFDEGTVNALRQFDDRIDQLRAAIAAASVRIPYLEALIARVEPPEQFPVDLGDGEEAAEAAA